MENIVIILAVAAAEEGKVEKRGGGGYAYGAPAQAVAGNLYNPIQYIQSDGRTDDLRYNNYYSINPAVAAPAAVAAVPAVATFKSGAPVGYSNAIPAAAIRNVETVGVTKTITPVVTKTTTYNTHSEPAVSVGHVQGKKNDS